MKRLILAIITCGLAKTLLLANPQSSEFQNIEQAKQQFDPLQRLMEGNERYVQDKPLQRDQDAARREALVTAQHPFAIIVSCSDSRVPPELIFDQGLGDLFVVRVAGNIVGPIELDSVEFAADALGTQLIVVLGHQNCGAVNAVFKGEKSMQDIQNIAPFIEPAIVQSRRIQSGDPLTNAIKQNAYMVAENLKTRVVLKRLIEENRLRVMSAYYNLNTGKVELLH